MSEATQRRQPDTLADMLRELGDIPADRVLWNPRPGTATEADQLRYTDPKSHTVLTATDTLTGGDVLPGFTLPLADFFNEPQLNPRPAQP